MDTLELAVDVRKALGKKARFLRREGITPANIYGRNLDSVALQLQSADLIHALTEAGRNAVLAVKVNGEKKPRSAVIRNVQRHPVTDHIVHVDFLQVDITRAITSEVPVILIGESPLPKTSTVISQTLSAIQVSGLPMDIPSSVEADISVLVEVDQSIHVSDLRLPQGVEVLTDADQMVVRAAQGRVSAADAAAEAEAEDSVAEGAEEAGADEVAAESPADSEDS